MLILLINETFNFMTTHASIQNKRYMSAFPPKEPGAFSARNFQPKHPRWEHECTDIQQ